MLRLLHRVWQPGAQTRHTGDADTCRSVKLNSSRFASSFILSSSVRIYWPQFSLPDLETKRLVRFRPNLAGRITKVGQGCNSALEKTGPCPSLPNNRRKKLQTTYYTPNTKAPIQLWSAEADITSSMACAQNIFRVLILGLGFYTAALRNYLKTELA